MQFTHSNPYTTSPLSWTRIWQSLTLAFQNWLSEEPQIEQHTNRQGRVEWRVYDPTSRRTLWLSSEADVFEWLESRYHNARSH